MYVLFDNGIPRGLSALVTGHVIEEARARGWEELVNGKLIEAAEQAGFDVLVTTDKNIRYQQNLKDRKLALVVLGNSQWPMVQFAAAEIAAAIDGATPGSYAEVPVSFRN